MSDPTFLVLVSQGAVRVNCIHAVTRGPNFFVFHVDLHAKYAELGPISNVDVSLYAGPDTLDAEPDRADPTVIHFHGLPEGATLDATISRYTLIVYVYVVDENAPLVWEACKHLPNWEAVTFGYEGADSAGVLDVPCRLCGRSGSLVVNASDVNWD